VPSSENFDPGRIRSARERVFGIRMRMPGNDPLRAVLGDDWETVRWYATEAERDAALADMRSQHRFSRNGDRPTLDYETITAPKPSSPVLPRGR
jgi:hypothetical protein